MATTFQTLAPRIMRDLLRDLAITKIDAAAIVGNLAHETADFRVMQELAPTVRGSRGGYGWAQWTGPRRRAFEAWAKARRIAPESYEANYGFLLDELRGAEKHALAALRRAESLDDKVVAFEAAYERAGVKAYPSRQRRAARSLAAFEAAQKAANPNPLSKSRTVAGGATAAVAGAGVAADVVATAREGVQQAGDAWAAGTWLGLALAVLVIAGAAVAIYARWDDAGRPWPGKSAADEAA